MQFPDTAAIQQIENLRDEDGVAKCARGVVRNADRHVSTSVCDDEPTNVSVACFIGEQLRKAGLRKDFLVPLDR
jgi:hypothetical protein